MKEYVLDANAVLRYLVKGAGVEILDRVFTQAHRGEAVVSISVINLGEVLYILAKRAGMPSAIETLRTFAHYIDSVVVSQDTAMEAATLKFNYKLGYADCFAAALAIRKRATLVTADPDFSKLGKLVKVLSLPRHRS